MTRKTYCGNLLWQSGLTLLAPDTDARPHQRPSRRAASRFFARLMCNLGWETFTDGTGFHKRPQYKDVPVPDDDPYVWVNL